MQIYGLNKLTLLDFPGHLACTLFTGGCNFRCPFCHNASLVLPSAHPPALSEQEFFHFLHKRQGVLEGVCITGGEPTLSPELPEFIVQIRRLGYFIKLDTNGSRPELLSLLLEKNLLDYVAMDIKNSRESYAKTCDVPELDLDPIEESIKLLRHSQISYEFRTTVVRGLHTTEDFLSIGSWLSGDSSYYLQGFQDSGELLSDSGNSFSAFSLSEMEQFRCTVLPWLPNTKLRGI